MASTAKKPAADVSAETSTDTTAPAPTAPQRFTLKKSGTYEFAAPDHLGGVRITLTRGEPVSPKVWPHVPEKDRDLFQPYTAPAPAAP